MVRSMYSGVAGMKANQGRMDVIGNNIANSNTYGFKSGRATFRDVYYQTYRGASAGTETRGGINPSSIGYGSQLSSIDLMMDSSSMTSTGFALDCAITGEGFFQVMDPDGNIYYTKAGMLDINPATGALVDSNGNFVLGTSATDGKLDDSRPGQNKIIISVDSVQASTARVQKEIAGKTVIIESNGQNKEANISFAFSKSTELPDGQKLRIVRDSTSSVYNVQLNENALFDNITDLNKLINDAISENYGGTHPGGPFSFRVEPDPFKDSEGKDISLTGGQLVDTPSTEYEGGSLNVDQAGKPYGFSIDSVGSRFTGSGATNLELKWVATEPAHVLVTMTTATGENGAANQVYTGKIYVDRLNQTVNGGSVLLSRSPAGSNANDTITMKYPGKSFVLESDDDGKPVGLAPSLVESATGTAPAAGATTETTPVTAWATATPQELSKKCGWGKTTFTLEGGTEFRTQDVSNLTGISIGADGIISATSDAGLQVLGRIDLATFANAKGLEQVGNSYFAETANSGKVKLAIAGEDGTGAIKNSALEMSNVDLAQEFADMIVTQRGFQASSRMITVSDTMLEELTNLKR